MTSRPPLYLLAVLTVVLSSCYRMPAEDEFSVGPTTNNPAVTNERPESFIPGMGY